MPLFSMSGVFQGFAFQTNEKKRIEITSILLQAYLWN
jgi:hypothetical protein